MNITKNKSIPKIIPVLILLFFILSCCITIIIGISKFNSEKQESFFNEYYERYMEAYNSLPGNFNENEQKVISTIEYIDSIIAKGRFKIIQRFYYDKSRLLFGLKRYEEAIDTLFLTKDDEYDYYKAILLMRLGRNDEATKYLNKVIDKQKYLLIKYDKQG